MPAVQHDLGHALVSDQRAAHLADRVLPQRRVGACYPDEGLGVGGIGVPVVIGFSLHPGVGVIEELACLLLSGGSGQVAEGLARFEAGADGERRHRRGPRELVQGGGCPALPRRCRSGGRLRSRR